MQNSQWEQFAESWMDWAGVFGEPRNYNRLAVALAEFDCKAQPWGVYIEFARRYAEHYHELHDERLLAHKEALEICGFTFAFDGMRWIATATGLECVQPSLASIIRSVEEWAIPLRAEWERTARYAAAQRSR